MAEEYTPMSDEEKYYRWAYKLLVYVAKQELKKLNAKRVNENDWPAGQEWDELGGTSRSIFMKKARGLVGINGDEFLKPIREGKFNVDDIWEDPN